MSKGRFMVGVAVFCLLLGGMFFPLAAEAADLVLTFPGGGERLPAGSTQVITWQGYETNNFEIYLSTDSGKNYDLFVGSGSGGVFTWTVPDISTERARIKISTYLEFFTHRREPLLLEAASTADFSIRRLPVAPSPPQAPSSLAAAALSDTEILLTWTDNADDEEGFTVYRDGTQIAALDTDTETYTDTGLAAETTYLYRVRAFHETAKSGFSNEARARTLPAKELSPPAAPDEPPPAEPAPPAPAPPPPAPAPPPPAPPPPQAAPEKVIRFKIGQADFSVDGSPKNMDTAPIIREGRTLLPIRYVAEPLGAEVEWVPEERKVLIILGDTAVELWIEQSLARVNSSYQHIDETNHDVRPIIVPPGRTMLPLRFITETLGCRVEWNDQTQEVTVQYDSSRLPSYVWRLPEPPADCARNVIDFEDLAAGTQVFHQYGSQGISFPLVPRIIEPADLQTVSGTRALSTYRPGQEFPGKLVIEFTTGQTCVRVFVGLPEDTEGNKVLATLEAFDAERMLTIPGYGMEIIPAEKVAHQQRFIGPGPAEISTPLFVETGDEPLIYRVELSFSGGFAPVIDDLGFATVGESFPTDAPRPEVVIETPQDKDCISGFETYKDAIDLLGTIREELMLEEVGVRVRQGEEVRENLLPFAGQAPHYTFGGTNIHGLLFPGENQLTVWAKSFSGEYGYSQTIQVHYNPLADGAEAELLILTPELFYEALDPLRNWKNNTGISSHIMTLEDIEREDRFGLADSRDLPERVKRAIARAYTYHDTRYVMLVGDGDRFPVRYHKAGREGVTWTWGVVYPITDLYYACLFKPDGTFDNWDGNNNDIIGEWWEPPFEWGVSTNAVDNFAQINIDNCGLFPHVAVGRIPASSIQEVETYVSKVIEYETGSTSPWFNRAVLWNAHDDFRSDDHELRYAAEELLPTFTALKHFREEGLESLPEATQRQKENKRRDRIMQDINQGAGFAIFFGHGSRRTLGPLGAPNISDLQNYGKYTVFIASACDTAKFVQEHDIYQDVEGNFPPCWPDCLPPQLPEPQGWEDPRPEPAPIQPSEVDVESMAEVLLFVPNKGGIGFLGATSGTNHASHPFVLRFIGSWNKEDVTRLGDMWTTAVQEFVLNYLLSDYEWAKHGNVDFGRNPFQSRHIHIFALFGDPSLRLKE